MDEGDFGCELCVVSGVYWVELGWKEVCFELSLCITWSVLCGIKYC